METVKRFVNNPIYIDNNVSDIKLVTNKYLHGFKMSFSLQLKYLCNMLLYNYLQTENFLSPGCKTIQLR